MYRVELQQFEGPMDLLLFFIKRDEIDIYDIPIARIADEYLAYVRVLEEIDLDGVGDFIYMAALLINIKAQMLLPSDGAEDDGEDVDPRRELVERLLEYVRFKEAADQLSTRRERRTDHFTRGHTDVEMRRQGEAAEPDIDASLYDLVEALADVLRQTEEDEPVHEVEPLQHSVEEQQRHVLRSLSDESRVSFRRLIEGQAKGFIIATFLALLELARQQYLRFELQEDTSDFWISEREGAPLQPDDPALPNDAETGENGTVHGDSVSTE